ncbi:PREDICTED: mucin-12-like [Vollenhovia emeryi]|uniref:mucin-12-like n=1 Tax=Vollenhovia emeryi TaxID=411798 RepID=UPI0005F521AC|nr:PREDICTED: mucin-12-like [Vollenhovia emeryi]
MTLAGRTSVRTVLLTSLLPISVVLVVLAVLARAGDVATLDSGTGDGVEPLPASREERPRPNTDASVTDHRRGRTSVHAELSSSKAKREQALRNILTARRRQLLNQRLHDPTTRNLSSRRPRPGDIVSKDLPDILETQETRHDIYVTNARTEVEEETPPSSRKSIEKVVSMVNLDAMKVEAEPQTANTFKNEALSASTTEKYENASSTFSSIAPTLTVFTNPKLGDADTRKKNTVAMPESLYNHFRPVESNIPVEDMSQFLYFGQKLQPDAQNVTNSNNNNSVETTSTNPTSSRRRYSTKRFSATISAPVEEIMNDEMNIALETLERRTIEKNQVSRMKNMFRSSSNGLYYRKPRPTADVVSNVIPGNESSPGIVSGSETRSEMNAVDEKFLRDRVPQERGNAAHVTEASTTQIPRQRQSDDDAEARITVESATDAKLTNGTDGVAGSLSRTTNDFGKDSEKKVTEMKTEVGNADKSEHKLTSAERAAATLQRASARLREESSTLRIVVPDDSFGLSSFAIESERTHRNTVKQQPVTDPVADRPVRASTSGDIAPKSSPSSTSPLTTESSAPVLVDSDQQSQQQQQQQQQQQHPQQHVYAYTITNVTRLLRNYTGPGLSGEEERRGEGGAVGHRAGSGAEITSGGPSQQRPQQQQQQPPPPPSSPLLLPRASDGSIEPARTPAGLSAGATIEPAAVAGALPSAVDGLEGERARKVVPQQQRASSQRTAATWPSSHSAANDSVIAATRSVKSPEAGYRGSVKWNNTKSRTSEQEGANDRRFLRKSASAVLNQRSTVNEESSSLTASKRRRVLTSSSGVSFLNGTRRVKSGEEKIEGATDKLVANDRSSNGTRAANRGKVSDDEVPGADSFRQVSRASGVNEVPSDSSSQETTVMGILNRNSSATDETVDATDPSVLVDAIATTELAKPQVLEEDVVTVSSLNDESDIESNVEDDPSAAMSNKTESDVNATTDDVVETTVTVTEQVDEMVAITTTSTSTTTTTVPAAPVFPVTPRILTEVEKTTVDPEAHTLMPTDIAKEANNLDPSEIQKRYRAKDVTTTTTTTSTTTVSPTQTDTHVDETSSRKSKVLPTSSTPTVTENGKRMSGERSPEVRARNLSDKSKDKDDVLPIMHLYNTSDIFNGSGSMDGLARGTERPRVVLPVDSESQNEDSPATTTLTATTTTTTTTEKSPELIAAVNNTEINRSTSTTVPVPKFKESTVNPTSSRKDKFEENRESQDTVVPSVSKGSSFASAANKTRYRPAYHHSILPEYNGTMYHPGGLNRTFFETGEPISVSPRESMNVSEVILKRHDGDVIATQETVAVVGYILATLVVFPIAVGVGLILRRLILRNRKVLEESDTSSEISCRKDALNLENGDFKTSIEKAITKLPRIQHLCHEAEKPSPPPSQESRWEFPRDKLRLQTVLGQGNFGQVWKAEADDLTGHQGTTRLVAVKTVKEGASDREKEDLDRELEIMKQLGSHPNVVTLLGCCTEKEPHYLILEYVMYGKLLAYLRDHRTRQYFYNFSEDSAALTSRDLTVFGYCVARGMEYLASKKIIHRDLAARNVLVDHNKLCKIADFGMSRFANEDGEVIETRHGRNALPIRWMAPESLIYSLFTTKTDVWSFGILMWEIVTLGSTPYPDMTAREVMRNVHNGYRLERPSHCRSELFRVISRCWHADPDRRPEFQILRRDLAQLLEDNMNGHYVDLESFASECTD